MRQCPLNCVLPALTRESQPSTNPWAADTLLVGLRGAIQSEGNPAVAAMLTQTCWATVISWCTYPVVYLFPFFPGFQGTYAVVGIQLGYCTSDIISKCGVGFLIYNITITKSAAMKSETKKGLMSMM